MSMIWHPSPEMIEQELNAIEIASFCDGVCRQFGGCARCLPSLCDDGDYTYEFRAVEVTKDRIVAPQQSRFAFWFKTAFWSLVGIMLLEDLRMIWWAWIR